MTLIEIPLGLTGIYALALVHKSLKARFQSARGDNLLILVVAELSFMLL